MIKIKLFSLIFIIPLRRKSYWVIKINVRRKTQQSLYVYGPNNLDVPSTELYIDCEKLNRILRSEVNQFVQSNKEKYKKT